MREPNRSLAWYHRPFREAAMISEELVVVERSGDTCDGGREKGSAPLTR
jgi:hypothetical protein